MIIRTFEVLPYLDVWRQMQKFTIERDATTEDEIWLLQHQPVYTLGQAGKKEHILNPGSIPIVQSDRGGQVTYHGPGQLVVYVLMDLNRKKIAVRPLVTKLEQITIKLLAEYNIPSCSRCDAPGVFVADKKIASIGLRIKNGCSYHGLALNVAMDLTPFQGINPCGFAKLQMTQISDYVSNINIESVIKDLRMHFQEFGD